MEVFSPLTRLWHITKEERSLIPENDDKATTGHFDIALLFEQTIYW